jgi:hypothetical protein
MADDVLDLMALLRRLAGRIPDDELASLRTSLGAGELDELEWSLVYLLRDGAVWLDEAELALLPMARTQPDNPFVANLPRTGDPTPEYRFEPADASADDDRLLGPAGSTPTLRRVVKARRIPVNDVAAGPDKVIYVAEFAASENIARQQVGLDWGLGGALFEAVIEGEELPPYQAAALAAGQPIWPSGQPR